MQKQELKDLLIRYAKGDCTPAEKKVLEDMILRKPLTGDWGWDGEEEKILMGLKIAKGIKSKLHPEKRISSKNRWYVGVAASLLLLIGIALFLQKTILQHEENELVISETAQSVDGITLTLSDGTVVKLDGHADGLISNGQGAVIKKVGQGQLVYEDATSPTLEKNNEVKKVAMNTVRIPNGKQFELTLPDGTKVWLNTASTLTYPVVFQGEERKVTLEGEAYFEVAHDKNRPFSVWANDTRIAVTGTHFNISAYPTDKAVTTTLLEGGVDVMKNGSVFKLTPGYRAITHGDGDKIIHQKANIENTLAWRSGYFVFDGEDIVSIMRSVARWYDIKVVFDENVSHTKFGGTFPIGAEIDELLGDLERLGNISFIRTGKEVRIMR